MNKNPADQYGDTLLHTAATYGRVEICLFILEKITEKNPSNKYGATPFHVAADYGNYSVCRLTLLRLGAQSVKLDKVNRQGQVILFIHD